MVNICIYQIDNRDPETFYLEKTMKINKRIAKKLNYDYQFIKMNVDNNIHPCTYKIFEIDKLIKNTNYNIIIFLDSDSWCNDPINLDKIVKWLINTDKNGCYSREGFMEIPWNKDIPPLMSLIKDSKNNDINSGYHNNNYINSGNHNNTYINSGGFILKVNDSVKNMYRDLISKMHVRPEYINIWPYDQYYISNYVFENRDNFIIFNDNILNKPQGQIISHNWWKNEQMHIDLDFLIHNDININHQPDFIIEQHLCKEYK